MARLLLPLALLLVQAPAPGQVVDYDVVESPPLLDAVKVAVAEDGSRFAVGHQDGRILLRDPSGEELRELDSLGTCATELSFAPAGGHLAAVSDRGELRVWDLGSEGPRSTWARLAWTGRPGWLFSLKHHQRLAWSPDGARLVSLHTNGTGCVWSARGKRLLELDVVPFDADPLAAWTAQGELVVADFYDLFIHRFGEHEADAPPVSVRTIACGDPVLALAVSPREGLLATGHANSALRLWSLRSGARLEERSFHDPIDWLYEPEDEVAQLAFSPDGARLAIATRGGTHVYVIDVATGEELYASEYLGAHFQEVPQLAWSRDGAHLWHSFACTTGDLWCVSLDGGAEPRRVLAGGRVPALGRGLGVALSGREVLRVSPEGRALGVGSGPR